MKKFGKLINQNLMMRSLGIMLLVLVLVIVGAISLYVAQKQEKDVFQHISAELNSKQASIGQIAQHTTMLFYRVRGYYNYPSNEGYSQIFEEKTTLENELDQYREYSLTPQEARFHGDIESFLQAYFNNTFPKAEDFIKDKRYEGLHELEGEARNTLDNLLVVMNSLYDKYDDTIDQNQTNLNESLKYRDVQYIMYVLAILLVLLVMMVKTARDFGVPIVKLADSASSFMSGHDKPVNYTKRGDEVGLLARALESMMIRIRSKEEELLAQNEELIAQQDELHMQQDELTKTIVIMEEKEGFLQQRNQFVNSISNTLDRDELLQSVIYSLVGLMKADKGLLLLSDMRDYASLGLSDQSIQQFIATYKEGVLPRLQDTLRPFQVKRLTTKEENGYHLNHVSVSDMYVPILNASDHIIAVFVLSRISDEFTDKDEEQLITFAKQIALSLEKLDMYEQTKHQRELTQDIMDTIAVGVQLLDLNGETIQINSSWKRIMGCGQSLDSLASMSFEHLEEILSKTVQDSEPLLQFIHHLVHGQDFSYQSFIYEMTSPERRIIELSSEPLYTRDTRVGTLLVHRDITKEYEADQMKSEFVSTVSHELRTPLASVLGFAELLLHKEMTAERQKKYIRTIHQEANRLTLLINDFLDLQRMESGKQTYVFNQASLEELINEVIEAQKVNSPQHTFEFINHFGQQAVKIDKNKIKQVLVNIISNAVKYSPQGGNVKVELSAEDNYVYIHISDEGLGIPQEAVPLLFQKFYRVDNSDRREIGGTGLGLAIVKEIMERHSGTVQVSSIYGEGSTFSLQLPYVSEGEEVGLLQNADTEVVYIVEDDANLSNLLADELKSNGYHVVQFTSGERALTAMLVHPPDAVILDIVLTAGMSGWDVIEKMKEHSSLSHVPILMSSAFEEAERAEELGARGYLLKPYYPHNLSAALYKIMNNHQSKGLIFVPDSSSVGEDKSQ